MNEITKCLDEMDEIQLLTVFNTIIKTNSQKASYQRANLVYIIEQLSDEELGSTIHLLSKMRYTKGYLDLILLQIILIIYYININSFILLINQCYQYHVNYVNYVNYVNKSKN